MCGIFGFVAKTKNFTNAEEVKNLSDTLSVLSESRGKEASGVVVHNGKRIKILKAPFRASKLVREKVYKELFEGMLENSRNTIGVVGHSRLATHGFQIENKNNQPVTNSFGTIVHNGIIVNEQEIWKKIGKKPQTDVDTEALLQLIGYYINDGYSVEDAIKKAFNEIKGSASISFLAKSKPFFFLATNTGSLYFSFSEKHKLFVFASEKYILEQLIKKTGLREKLEEIEQIKSKRGISINQETLKISSFDLNITSKKTKEDKPKKMYQIEEIPGDFSPEKIDVTLYSTKNKLSVLRRHDFDYKAIYNLKRCTRCILPQTMPFITFDEEGVCNYCHEYKKIKPKGKKELKKLIEPFKSKNGEPDSIIAFSGGRDSSYGLHYLKKELGLNPVAYTYDWGMVTDLARRNEARMVGELGLEHIIVSADISLKRTHIRKHILAWMKKPDLGMVPLFMEGDKQCVYYSDQLADKMGIDLLFYCRGNDLENEEFKWGHCGIRDATPKGVIHDLSLGGRVKIASYYANQYIRNPSYINSSIFDTAFAYFSTYIQNHDHIYLWHYIDWDEDKIVSTLKNEYGWETENGTTWRTDDGTPAFYNYIYYKVQGFTENDTFRSNQIRRGILEREKALKLVKEENKPRYEGMKWYFDVVGLDGDEVLTVVDNMPRLY